MPAWRYQDDHYSMMQAHKPFVHSLHPPTMWVHNGQFDEEGVPLVEEVLHPKAGEEHIVPKFHFLAEGQLQHDGSWIVHHSHNVAEVMRRDGLPLPELVSNEPIQYHGLHNELGKWVGIWSVWTALGGRRHDRHAEPSDALKTLYRQHEGNEHHDAVSALWERLFSGNADVVATMRGLAEAGRKLEQRYTSGAVDPMALVAGLAHLHGIDLAPAHPRAREIVAAKIAQAKDPAFQRQRALELQIKYAAVVAGTAQLAAAK